MLEFERISEHIQRLELSGRLFGLIRIPVAIWLVRSPDGWTLVDTGPPEAADPMISAVLRATEGRGPDRVLLTHGHFDHAGGLAAIRLAWNPPVMCHRDEVPFLIGEADYRRMEVKDLAARLAKPFWPTVQTQVPIARDLEAGQSADGMAVIHLPGHSPGQIGFLHPADRALICGDAVLNLGGRLAPPPAAATPDPHRAANSMRRLGELDFDHLLPSHGPPIVGNGRQRMLAFLAARGLAHP